MSGLDERLRDLARRHERTTEYSSTVAEHDGATSPAERIRRAAQDYLEVAVDRRAATRPQVHHGIHCVATEEGFTLNCGDGGLLTAALGSDGWHVTVRKASRTVAERVYESDDSLLSVRNDLVQLLDAGSQMSGAGSQIRSEIKPSRFDLAADRPKGRVKAPGGSTLATRRSKLILYIVAFGVGLTFSRLLDRHGGHFTDHREIRRPAVHSLGGRVSQSHRNAFHRPAQVVLQRRASAGVPARPSPNTTSSTHRVLTLGTLDRAVRPAPKPSPSGVPAYPLAVAPVAENLQNRRDGSRTSEPDIRFHVQAGVFDAHEDAGALVRRLRSLGYAVSVHGDAPYRVFVGGYLDEATADRLVENLQKAGFAAVLQP